MDKIDFKQDNSTKDDIMICIVFMGWSYNSKKCSGTLNNYCFFNFLFHIKILMRIQLIFQNDFNISKLIYSVYID